MNNRVALADIRKELVAEALALGSALDKARDIDELDGRRCRFLRVAEFREKLKTLIRNGDDSDIRIDRAERIIRGLRASLCE